MDWRTAVGAAAVLAVVGLFAGAVASLATTNDLLTGSAQAVPALVVLGVALLAFAVAVVLARPSRDWLTNPYW